MVSHQSGAESCGQTFTPLREVGLVVFVCGRPGESRKSENNQVGCDHGVTSVPRVTLVPYNRTLPDGCGGLDFGAQLMRFTGGSVRDAAHSDWHRCWPKIFLLQPS
jgi:hypothetical protein